MSSNLSKRRWRNGKSSMARCVNNSSKTSTAIDRALGAGKLHGHPDGYKIKLRAIGYRLVYQVEDRRLMVLVAVGKRERNAVYKVAAKR